MDENNMFSEVPDFNDEININENAGASDVNADILNAEKSGEISGDLTSSENIKAPRKNIRAVFIACAVVVVAAALVLIFTLSGANYGSAIDKSVAVYKNPTVSTVKALYPQEALDFALQTYSLFNSSYTSIDELIQSEMLADITEDAENYRTAYGSDFGITYKIVSAEKMSADALQTLKDELEESSGISEKNVREAYRISLSYTISGTDSFTGTLNTVAVNVSGGWYVADGSTIGYIVW